MCIFIYFGYKQERYAGEYDSFAACLVLRDFCKASQNHRKTAEKHHTPRFSQLYDTTQQLQLFSSIFEGSIRVLPGVYFKGTLYRVLCSERNTNWRRQCDYKNKFHENN